MRHGRILGLCMVAAFALSGFVASSALASEPPTVTSVVPTSGPTSYQGTNSIYIKGTGFQEGAKVKFGATEAEGVSVISETELAVQLPNNQAAGAVEVIVEDENGTSTGGPQFTYIAPEKASWSWSKMKNCPFNGELEGQKVEHCDYASTRTKYGGFYSVGPITVPVIKPIVLQGGATEEHFTVEGAEYMEAIIPPENGAPPIVPAAEKVPAEVLNNVSEAEMNEFGWPQNLRDSYKLAKKKGFFKANRTSEIIEPAGKDLDYLSPFNGLVEEGPEIIARVQIKGENPWLTLIGGSCQIGSEAEPIVQHLQTGTSVSPLTGEPLHGKPGFAELHFNFEMAALTEISLVDNTYAVPGATKCGGSNWESYLDPVVNKAFGLPAPAGASETVLDGAEYTSTRLSAKQHLE